VIDRLEPGYGPLFDRVVDVFLADDRVRGMWLSGSLARGTADIASDLDVLIAVSDDDPSAFDQFAAEWRAWLAAITPTVIARPLVFAPGSLYSVTPGRERLDIVVERTSALPHTMFRTRLTVFDRDDLDGRIPAPAPAAGPSGERVAALVEEFFRDYGMFPVVVEREDWLLGIEAIHLFRSLLYQLFVEANAPLPMMGLKQWSAKLTTDQRELLESLPAGCAANRESIIAVHEEVGLVFVDQARRICAALDVAWPDELENATREYLRGHGLPSLD
jgi:predicted nucleotidyltransferase